MEEVKKPPVAEVPLPDVTSGEDLFPQEKAKMEAEAAEFSKKMEAHWWSKADAKDWDSVATNLEVCALAGQAVDSDPRRTPEYRAKVIEGLRLGPSENRPGTTVGLRRLTLLPLTHGWPQGPSVLGRRNCPFYGPKVCARLRAHGASGQFPTARAPG